MISSLILFFLMLGIVLVYFRGAALFTVLFAILLFAVVPSVALWVWTLFAPTIAEQQYLRGMGWSDEEAEKYRSDLRDAANAGARNAKGQRALTPRKMNNRQPVPK